MSQLDKLKEQIGFLKVVFSLFVAVNASIIAWLFNNSDNTSDVKIIIATLAVCFIALAIALITKVILKKIDDVEDL